MSTSPNSDDCGYESPEDALWRPGQPLLPAGFVKHVPAVGILSMTQGLVESLVGRAWLVVSSPHAWDIGRLVACAVAAIIPSSARDVVELAHVHDRLAPQPFHARA